MQPFLAAIALIIAHAPATMPADGVAEMAPTPTSHAEVRAEKGTQIDDQKKESAEATSPNLVVMDEQPVAVRRTESDAEGKELQGPPLPPLTSKEAKSILKRPRGTLSNGKTNGGELVNGRRIRLRGNGYAFFDHIKERETYFGTYEMKRFIERTGIRFKKLHKWSAIGLGNVSVHEGGKTRWHASHQSGRDVDIAMFGKDKRGRSVNPRNFTRYNSALESPSGLTFDVPRNTDLVRTLLTDPEYQVQWIFVARWLKRKIMANAKKRGFEPWLVTRMDKVMKQPGDSAPHDDHYHLRLYCAVEDRMHGCVERGPVWDWVDLGDAVFEAHVDNLERVLDMPEVSYRLQAMSQLHDIRAYSSIPTLLEQLDDSRRKVRRAALGVLASFRSPAAVDGLLDRVSRINNLSWSGQLFRTALRSAKERKSEIAHAFITNPAAMIHPDLVDQNLSAFLNPVIKLLRSEADPSIIPSLIALLESKSAAVRTIALNALRDITTHQVAAKESEGEEDQGHIVQSWKSLWEANRDHTWADWTRDGLINAGYELAGDVEDPVSIKAIIEATGDKREYISQNAVRLLGVVTGHMKHQDHKSARQQRAYWRRWYQRQQAKTRGAN